MEGFFCQPASSISYLFFLSACLLLFLFIFFCQPASSFSYSFFCVALSYDQHIVDIAHSPRPPGPLLRQRRTEQHVQPCFKMKMTSGKQRHGEKLSKYKNGMIENVCFLSIANIFSEFLVVPCSSLELILKILR